MSTIDLRPSGGPQGEASQPLWKRYKAASHFRSREDEFDACKLGMWLFLTTEVLLFGGLFCAYAILRMKHPEMFVHGSGYLDWRWGALNTVVLLISSYTMAAAITHVQSLRGGQAEPAHHAGVRGGVPGDQADLRVHPEVDGGQAPGLVVRVPLRDLPQRAPVVVAVLLRDGAARAARGDRHGVDLLGVHARRTTRASRCRACTGTWSTSSGSSCSRCCT